jgi:hypothetical protein
MKKIFLPLILAAFVFTLPAQVPVKKDLLQMFAKIPAPPLSVKESYSAIAVAGAGGMACSAEKIFSPVEREAKSVETEYESQPRPGMGSAAPGISPEQAKKMNDPEMKKKMKSMSKEERMKMAMEMMNSAQTGSSAAETDPPPVRAALDEWQKIYNTIQKEYERSVKEQQEELDLSTNYANGHEEIASWESSEIAKLPQISSGEMSAPDPKKVKEVKLRSADKHIALADKRLEQIRSRWNTSMDRTTKRYALFHQKLAEAEYAAGSKNFSSKKILSDAQMMMLKDIHHFTERSRSAWEESASWMARRGVIEKE